MMSSLAPCYVIHLRLKYLPQHPILFIICIDSHATDSQNDYDFAKNKTEG